MDLPVRRCALVLCFCVALGCAAARRPPKQGLDRYPKGSALREIADREAVGDRKQAGGDLSYREEYEGALGLATRERVDLEKRLVDAFFASRARQSRPLTSEYLRWRQEMTRVFVELPPRERTFFKRRGEELSWSHKESILRQDLAATYPPNVVRRNLPAWREFGEFERRLRRKLR